MAQSYLNGLVDIHQLPPDDVVFGRSPQMAIVRSKIKMAAATDVPVLLQGESGTGKEILARLLHIRSRRARLPWVKVMCPAIPNSLIESELFGYERGAFTGANATKRGRVELAHGGTLFLDEIGSLDLSVQAKLLQVLQDGSFMRVGGQETRSIDTRILSSANVDLKSRTEDGSFRLDFLYRLNAVTIDLPPLRKRIEDLPILVDYFLELYSQALQRTPTPLSAEMICLMRRFDWPGNIRQLENLIRGYMVIGSEDVLAAELVPSTHTDQITEIDLAKPVSLKQITREATAKLEWEIICKVLEANGGSRRKTAKWLNISYRSLLYKMGEAHSAGYALRQ
jgi:two-component system, NtrC family, response regulator AtoC